MIPLQQTNNLRIRRRQDLPRLGWQILRRTFPRPRASKLCTALHGRRSPTLAQPKLLPVLWVVSAGYWSLCENDQVPQARHPQRRGFLNVVLRVAPFPLPASRDEGMRRSCAVDQLLET
jgi:hypothetical protein